MLDSDMQHVRARPDPYKPRRPVEQPQGLGWDPWGLSDKGFLSTDLYNMNDHSLKMTHCFVCSVCSVGAWWLSMFASILIRYCG